MTDAGRGIGNRPCSEVRVHVPTAAPVDLRAAVREAVHAVHAPLGAGTAPPEWRRTTSGDARWADTLTRPVAHQPRLIQASERNSGVDVENPRPAPSPG
ncbi:hypothetical protein OG462_36245 [Streptomyces sp. NBC_01077]|uniref:hypothetical protein n=1 Tax=Streptomyces sp. NBC_01077 TaxID=2903746 RepID=UPI003864CFA7|nr:hypothetical protein OG462_36245 [Streptomyces sp. NBC_01077]